MPWDFFLGKNVDTPTDRDTSLLVNCAFFSQLIIQPTLLKISCQVKISSQDSELNIKIKVVGVCRSHVNM